MNQNDLLQNLAINGGPKTITKPLPARHHFGEAERNAAVRVINEAMERGDAPGYGGPEEEAFCKEFAARIGGGYADAVNSGTNSVFVALRSLPIEPFTEIISGPITDCGGMMPIAMMNCIPVIADSAEDSFNVSVDTIKAVYTERTSAIVVSHIAGEAADMEPIIAFAKAHNLYVVEDCSQAHGAKINGKYVGTFGDTAGYSLMFGKHTCAGGQGGMAFTTKEEYYWKLRQNSDRGKPFGLPEGSTNCVASLNFNMDEIHCAIGRVQTAKMDDIAEKRRKLVKKLFDGIERKDILRSPKLPATSEPSYWFTRMIFDVDKVTCDKHTFCEALSAEGFWVGESYDATPHMYEWCQKHKAFGNSGYPWAAPEYKGDHNMTYSMGENISKVYDQNINFFITESFTDEDIQNIINTVNKVIAAYAK